MKTTDDPEPYWLKEERERSREKESTPLLLKAEAKDVEAGTNQPSWLRETPSPDVPHTTPFNTENKSARKPLKWKAPEASAAKNSVDVEEDCCCCPRDPVLYYFYMYHFVTFLVGLFCIVANVSIIADSRSMWRDRIMHSYMCLFSVVVVAVEIGKPMHMRVYVSLRACTYLCKGLHSYGRYDINAPMWLCMLW